MVAAICGVARPTVTTGQSELLAMVHAATFVLQVSGQRIPDKLIKLRPHKQASSGSFERVPNARLWRNGERVLQTPTLLPKVIP